MSRTTSSTTAVAGILCFLVLAIGCRKAPPAAASAPSVPELETSSQEIEPASNVPTPAPESSHAGDLNELLRIQNETRAYLKTIYFDFDMFELTLDAMTTLQTNAAWLKQHEGFDVLIEGHCDERDTAEYNMALGDRRAHAVRRYLIDLGVESSRLRTISYGEERPADPGHGEAAWARNRRADFTVETVSGDERAGGTWLGSDH